MNHCMIDLETLGTLPGSVIMSLGAVAFNQGRDEANFYTNIGINSCLNTGMVVDAGAIKFWFTQTTQEARGVLFTGLVGLREALHSFNEFWKTNNCKWLWSHGLNFDVPHLDVAYGLAGYNEFRPWGFRECRDTRTIFSLLPGGKAPEVTRHSGQHNALSDAVYQAELVRRAYVQLGREMEAA